MARGLHRTPSTYGIKVQTIMKLAREILICVCLIALVGALIQGSLFIRSATDSADSLTKVAGGVDLMRVTLQSQLAGKYGLLAEATAAVRESRKTIDVLQKTSLAERAKVAAFSDASIQAVQDLDGVAVQARAAVGSLQGAVDGLGRTSAALTADAEAGKPVIDGAGQLLATLNSGSGQALDRVNGTIGHLDGLVMDAKPIEDHIDEASKTAAHATVETDKILTGAEEWLYNLEHPKKRGFWSEWAIALLGPTARIVLDHLWPIRVEVVH